MPQFPINQTALISRPINCKIVFKRYSRYVVYNVHNNVVKEFFSLNSMFNYYSPRTKYIDFQTSMIINKEASRSENQLIVNNTKIIVYLDTETMNYKRMNGEVISNEMLLSDSHRLFITQFPPRAFAQRIEEIQRILLNRYEYRRGEYVTANSNEHMGRSFNYTLRNASDTNDSVAQQEEINEHLIYGYHGGPRDIHLRKHETDTDNEKRFYGIELEVDGSRDPNASSRKKHTLATRLNTLLNNNDYNSLVKFETDGSIGNQGVEIITQPMTMKFISNNKALFKEAMRTITSLNYSSHDSGKCGMHIHVSRNALTENAIDNLYLLFENFKNEIIAFSRRNENQMSWCRFIINNNNDTPDNITDQYIKNNKPCGNSHHSAINNGNRETVEFRIFRGTVKTETFLANIQLIDNMIDIALNHGDLSGITWNDIINHNSEFTELIEYNEKRGIYSKHEFNINLSKLEVTQRPVILVRPFQIRLEGDN